MKSRSSPPISSARLSAANSFSVACLESFLSLSSVIILHPLLELRDGRRNAARVVAVPTRRALECEAVGVAEVQLHRAGGNLELLHVAGAGAGEAIADEERLSEQWRERGKALAVGEVEH